MKKLIIPALAAVLAVASVSGATAQQAGGQTSGCQSGKPDCKAPTQQTSPSRQLTPARQATTTTHNTAPKVGASGRSGASFQRRSTSSLAAAPSGQEYRVVSNHLVLVNSGTRRITRIVGPVADYMK